MFQLSKKIVAAACCAAIFTVAAEATPAFARQMQMDCMTCHTQNVPKLNRFGRDFKMSGFTMTGGVTELVSEEKGGLQIPDTLNMGFIIKARVHDANKGAKTGTPATHDTFTEIYDESAFVFGGKIAEYVGTSMEFGAGLLGGKITFSKEFSFGRLGATYFTTDALGVFSGTEIYTTGLYRPIRQFENRKLTNIFQKTGVGDGTATGVQIYYYGNDFYATVGQYVPTWAQSVETGKAGYKLMARAAYEVTISDFSVAFGGFYLGGDVTDMDTSKGNVFDENPKAFDQKASGLDLQIEGDIAGMSLMVTSGIVISNTYTDLVTAIAHDESGFSIDAQLNPMETFGVKAAFLAYDDNKVASNNSRSYSLGVDYNMRQNVRFALEYSYTDYPDTAVNKKADTDILFLSMIAF